MNFNVLHLVEPGGGGTLSALRGWIKITPEFNHTVVIRRIESEHYEGIESLPNCKVFYWDGAFFVGINYLKLVASNEEYDVLHLHSSLSGLARFRTWGIPTVYSPHCYAFLKTDVPVVLRSFYKFVERLLAFRTSGYVCVSNYEERLSYRISQTKQSVVIEHVIEPWKIGPAQNYVIGMGRLCNQKNPVGFLEIVKITRAEGMNIQFLWIGEGEERFRNLLVEHGVEVTGWLKESEILDLMSNALLLLHCALWEGMPMVFSEALAGGLPILAKSANYLQDENRAFIFNSNEEALLKIKQIYISKKRNVPILANRFEEGKKLSQFYIQVKSEHKF